MNLPLPPVALTKAWLSIIQDKRIPSYIIQSRIRLLNKYFGGREFAILYLEQESLK
jgi:hypothetical protein